MSRAEDQDLLDRFAMAALTGLMANPQWDDEGSITANVCYGVAEWMMRRREMGRVIREPRKGKPGKAKRKGRGAS